MPRKGQYLILARKKKNTNKLFTRIILPVPTILGKGVLIQGIHYNNFISIGPTSENQYSRTDSHVNLETN